MEKRLTLTESRRVVNDLTNDKTKNFWQIDDEEKATQMLYDAAMERLKLKILGQGINFKLNSETVIISEKCSK